MLVCVRNANFPYTCSSSSSSSALALARRRCDSLTIAHKRALETRAAHSINVLWKSRLNWLNNVWCSGARAHTHMTSTRTHALTHTHTPRFPAFVAVAGGSGRARSARGARLFAQYFVRIESVHTCASANAHAPTRTHAHSCACTSFDLFSIIFSSDPEGFASFGASAHGKRDKPFSEWRCGGCAAVVVSRVAAKTHTLSSCRSNFSHARRWAACRLRPAARPPPVIPPEYSMNYLN